MKYLGEKSASSVMKVVLDVAWYLALVGAVLLVLFMAYWLVGDPALPTGLLQIETPGLTFRFTGVIQEPVLRTKFALQFILIYLLLAVGLLVLFQLRKIFANLAGRTPFTKENVRRIRIIGIAAIVYALLSPVVYCLMGLYLSNIIHLPGVELIASFRLDLGGIFLGAVIIILAEVFNYGARLQEEQDLTV
ncbi:MAG: DUF2975 domain-containing protein [Dethiobacteria bacterium]